MYRRSSIQSIFWRCKRRNFNNINALGDGTTPAFLGNCQANGLKRKKKARRPKAMKKLSTIMTLTAAATFALATSSFSGAVPHTTEATAPTVDQQTIAQLEDAANKALADGRAGNKNNIEFRRKNYEINLLIDRLQSGQQVDPSEIDKAMEPVHVW
jgi:hypothetical protein